MRILLVCPAPPERPSHGAAPLVASQLIEHLSERHTFGVVAAAAALSTGREWLASRSPRIDIVPAEGPRRLSGRRDDRLRPLAAAMRRAAAEFQPDVVHLETARLAPLARTTEVPSVVRCPEPPPQSEGLGDATACVVDCEDDRRAMSAHLPIDRIDIIPAGIDAERYVFRRTGSACRLVFTGDVGNPADLEAARRLATSILPRVRQRLPRAELLIAVTDSAEPARDLGRLDGVRVEGRLSDLRPSVWGAGVYVSPLASGAGRVTRLLETLALGTPVVASPASLTRLDDVVPGHHVMTAVSDAELADAVCLLLREPVVGATLARNARALVEQRRTWRAVAQRYEHAYQRLARPALERAA